MALKQAGTYVAPRLAASEVTPLRVRDELVRCFMSAMSCLPMPPDAVTDPAKMQMQVESFVREAFAKSGASFDKPTKKAILAAMSECRRGAVGMSLPEPVIEGHWTAMMTLVDRLPNERR